MDLSFSGIQSGNQPRQGLHICSYEIPEIIGAGAGSNIKY
jgi:hypothetical protein